jgi:polyhydroxyalkanoate synthase
MQRNFSPRSGVRAQPDESATRRLDRLVHASAAPFTAGLSPVSLALAVADWAWHLGVSPGRQLELLALAGELSSHTLLHDGGEDQDVGLEDDDPRFRHEAWSAWPFRQYRTAFRDAETFWQSAAVVPGMTAHHTHMTRFFAKQWLGMLTPANWLPTNPVVLNDAVESHGTHLLKGMQSWMLDASGVPAAEIATELQQFVVGRDVAITPGKVVFRNRLMELIRFDAQTGKVYPEPLLIIPSWIMKYYILDLSPHNSLVRYLVEQGHTVYILSWFNPGPKDHDLSMDDYLRLGVFDALRAVGISSGTTTGVHAAGYCLGGTLLSIAAARLGHADAQGSFEDLPPLESVTLLAAQTDFSEPGELGLFVDESQVGFLDNVARSKGYFSGKDMAASFQFLHSRDLVWTRRMREYLMGEREGTSDLAAWNADTTRIPARLHHEYLTTLYLHNALAENTYRVDGRAVSLSDIHIPVFLVATQRDHISPWKSVHKLHSLTDTEITFLLASGGHNVGIVSEPGHSGRSYQMSTRAAHGAWLSPEAWATQALCFEGSWWPAWHQWLVARSHPLQAAKAAKGTQVLCDAPGEYVLQRYAD